MRYHFHNTLDIAHLQEDGDHGLVQVLSGGETGQVLLVFLVFS